jgi:hypothetical protein
MKTSEPLVVGPIYTRNALSGLFGFTARRRYTRKNGSVRDTRLI